MHDTEAPPPASALRPIARDTSDFPKLRRSGCIYVDKTAFFHRLVADESTNCYFLSRPRRFGKSLMITTLRAIFEGRRELFDGLAIAGTDWAWEPHPVIKFNFAGVSTLTPEAFDATFPQHVRSCLEAAATPTTPPSPHPSTSPGPSRRSARTTRRAGRAPRASWC